MRYGSSFKKPCHVPFALHYSAVIKVQKRAVSTASRVGLAAASRQFNRLEKHPARLIKRLNRKPTKFGLVISM